MHAQTSSSIYMMDKKAQTFRSLVKYYNYLHVANQSNASYKYFQWHTETHIPVVY